MASPKACFECFRSAQSIEVESRASSLRAQSYQTMPMTRDAEGAVATLPRRTERGTLVLRIHLLPSPSLIAVSSILLPPPCPVQLRNSLC